LGVDEASDAKFVVLEISAVASLSRHPTGVNSFTVDLTVLKAMSQALAALFSFVLPVPFKR